MTKVAKFLAITGGLALASNAGAMIVETRVVSGDGLTASSQLVVEVRVRPSSNISGNKPQSGTVRLRWHGSQDPVGSQAYNIVLDTADPGGAPFPPLITAGDLGGGVGSKPDEVDNTQAVGEPMTFRDISTVGDNTIPPEYDGGPTDNDPIVFQVTFNVTADAQTMANPRIIVEADPDAAQPFPFITIVPPAVGAVSVTQYDSSATSFTSVGEWMLLDE